MQIFKRIAALLALVLLAACSNIETVKDFEKRSVAYGWVDIKDIEINSISAIYIQQYRPKTESPYYTTGGAGVVTGDYYMVAASRRWWDRLPKPTQEALQKLVLETIQV